MTKSRKRKAVQSIAIVEEEKPVEVSSQKPGKSPLREATLLKEFGERVIIYIKESADAVAEALRKMYTDQRLVFKQLGDKISFQLMRAVDVNELVGFNDLIINAVNAIMNPKPKEASTQTA